MSTQITKAMVDGMLTRTVQEQVRSLLVHAIRPLAEQAVSDALTPDVLDELAEVAAEAVSTQVDNIDTEGEPEPEPAPPQLRYKSLPEFVDNYVLPNWRHAQNKDSRWCTTWWKHAEAITHLEALWESFEELRVDPAGTIVSTFLLQYFIPHMTYLTSPQGPFWLCSAEDGKEKHGQPPLWTHEPPPEGVFAVAD